MESDINALNDAILALFSDNLGDESKQTRIATFKGRPKPLKDVIGPLCNGHPVCNWNVMHSSGNQNDCLIHSFLTATCPAFRRLPEDQKIIFAQYFRNEVYFNHSYPAYMHHLRHTEDSKIFENGRDRILSGKFLIDEDINALAFSYKINFIIFESETREVVRQFADSERGNKRLVNTVHVSPPQIQYFDNYGSHSVYLLANNQNIHFESVRTDKGRYYITTQEARRIYNEFETRVNVKPNIVNLTNNNGWLPGSHPAAVTAKAKKNQEEANAAYARMLAAEEEEAGKRQGAPPSLLKKIMGVLKGGGTRRRRHRSRRGTLRRRF